MTIKWHEFFMRQVYLVASMSKDASTKIGAVIVRDKQVIAQGYNGIPMGVADDGILAPERHEKPAKYMWYEHGERNSIFCCARHGTPTLGATLYTQGIPCADCARAVIQAGIKCVVVHGPWMKPQTEGTFSARWQTSCDCSVQMFREARVELLNLSTVLDLEGFVDGTTISV